MQVSSALATLLLAGLCSVVGCSEELAPPEPNRSTIDDATFARALSDLVVARIELLPDTAAYELRADEILQELGITAEDLRTFVEVHGQDDDRMTRTYARLEARLDSLYPTGQPEAGTVLPGVGSLVGPDTLAVPRTNGASETIGAP